MLSWTSGQVGSGAARAARRRRSGARARVQCHRAVTHGWCRTLLLLSGSLGTLVLHRGTRRGAGPQRQSRTSGSLTCLGHGYRGRAMHLAALCPTWLSTSRLHRTLVRLLQPAQLRRSPVLRRPQLRSLRRPRRRHGKAAPQRGSPQRGTQQQGGRLGLLRQRPQRGPGVQQRGVQELGSRGVQLRGAQRRGAQRQRARAQRRGARCGRMWRSSWRAAASNAARRCTARPCASRPATAATPCARRVGHRLSFAGALARSLAPAYSPNI